MTIYLTLPILPTMKKFKGFCIITMSYQTWPKAVATARLCHSHLVTGSHFWDMS